jgi:hypothetical protein
MSEDWKIGDLVPIFKNGDKILCKNYRSITISPVAYKVLADINMRKLIPFMESIVGDNQCGFRSRRSTVYQIFVLKQITEKSAKASCGQQ